MQSSRRTSVGIPKETVQSQSKEWALIVEHPWIVYRPMPTSGSKHPVPPRKIPLKRVPLPGIRTGLRISSSCRLPAGQPHSNCPNRSDAVYLARAAYELSQKAEPQQGMDTVDNRQAEMNACVCLTGSWAVLCTDLFPCRMNAASAAPQFVMGAIRQYSPIAACTTPSLTPGFGHSLECGDGSQRLHSIES
jgi:hypothetical protein